MQNRGSALISALFVMTLIAITTVAMVTHLRLDIYRSQLVTSSSEAYFASQAVTFWAMSELADAQKKFPIADKWGKIAQTPRAFQTMHPKFRIQGELYDLQARFNLNNLQTTKFQSVFFTFLSQLATDLTNLQREELVKAISHWVSSYQLGLGQDEFRSYYLAQSPPYSPSHQLIESVSEFRLIRGVTAKHYKKLVNYLSALPEITPINLNTAPPILLKALGHGLDDLQVDEIITARGKSGIQPKILTELLTKLSIPSEQVCLKSRYFLSIATVAAGDLTFSNYVIIKRQTEKNNKFALNVLSESLNAPDWSE